MTETELSALVDRVRALEETTERIQERVPFVSRLVPQDAYHHKLQAVIEAARRVCEWRGAAVNVATVPVEYLDELDTAVSDLLAASWGRS